MKEGDNMRILKISKVNTFLVSIMMMAVLLCCSSQVQADQSGDYTYDVMDGEAQITGYTGTGGVVTIPSTLGGFPVTSIGDQAFMGNPITSISIPEGVTSISDIAFATCFDLTSITVANNNLNYKSIDGMLFNKAGTSLIACPEGLTSISIPQGVTSIGNYAFAYCNNITNFSIPQGVKSIGDGAFLNCLGLTSISISQGVTSIGDKAFFACDSLTNITFNSATTIIADSADTIPATTIIIGHDPSTAKDYAAKYSRTFEVISTTNTLQSIAITTPATKLSYSIGDKLDINGLVVTGTYSDGSTKVESITAANISGFNSTTAVVDQVLTITVGTKTTTYKVQIVATLADTDYTYTVTDGKAQITKYTGTGGVVTIPSTLGGAPVTSIGTFAFRWSLITTINIPQGVTSIGDFAFYGCYGLTTVSIQQGLISIGNGAFSITSLTTINIPQGVTSIGDGAFYDCKSLTSIGIAEGVKSIGDNTFAGCTGLTSINLPKGLTIIGDRAFSHCTGLTSINIPQGVTSIGNGAFSSCTGLKTISVSVDNLNYASINGMLFNKAGTTLITCPEALTNINIPQGVTSIGDWAFSSCTGLTSIGIPEGVTIIGEWAFSYCKGLTSINLPQGLTIIRNGAFVGCTGLTSIGIPEGVTSIGGQTFSNCTGLTSINLPQGLTSIGYGSFSCCTGLTSISLPQGLTIIDDGAFGGCNGLTTIRFNSASTTIYDSADTIPAETKIIGYARSTAKTYASKYNRKFEVIGTTTDIKVTGVKLNKKVTTINVGANEILSVTISPTNATNKDVTWKSSNVAVATVDSNGKVVGLKAGTATITVTTQDGGKAATCKVTVKGAPIIKVTKVSLNKKTTSINIGANENLTPTVSPTTATNQNVTWKSSNIKIATVDSKGNVVGIKAGKATITVTTVDGKKTANCTVTVSAIKK